MKNTWEHIEDFVREKLNVLDSRPTDDWQRFEQKLKRAIFFRRLKLMSGVVGLVILLFTVHKSIQGDGHIKMPTTHENTYPQSVEIDDSYFKVQQSSTTKSVKAEKFESASTTATTPGSPAGVSVPVSKPQALHAKADGSASSTAQNSKPSPAQPSQARNNSTAAQGKSTVAQVQTSKTEPFDQAVYISGLKPKSYRSLASEKGEAASLRNQESDRLLFFNFKAPTLNLGPEFLAIRMPNFSALKGSSNKPYVSPLNNERRWNFALNFYPNFAFRRFSFTEAQRSLLHSDFIDATQSSERTGVNINVGFEVSRRIGPITYVNSGLEYINNSFRAKYNFTNFREAVIDPNTGKIIRYNIFKDPEQVAFNDVNRFHYLNLPLSISHKPWVNDYLRINLEFGFNLLYFMGASGNTLDYTTLEVIDISERQYRKFLGSSNLTVGIHYFVNPRLNLGLEPSIMYFSNTIYSEEMPFQVVPFSVGLNINLQYKLR